MFMKPEIVKDRWVCFEDDHGEMFYSLLGYYEPHPSHTEVKKLDGFGVRLSAPGYMDCTEWCVFDTKQECVEYLEQVYDIYKCKECGGWFDLNDLNQTSETRCQSCE